MSTDCSCPSNAGGVLSWTTVSNGLHKNLKGVLRREGEGEGEREGEREGEGEGEREGGGEGEREGEGEGRGGEGEGEGEGGGRKSVTGNEQLKHNLPLRLFKGGGEHICLLQSALTMGG